MNTQNQVSGLKETVAQTSQRDTPSLTSAELFDAVKASGIPFSNHESDLYVKRTPGKRRTDKKLSVSAERPNLQKQY